MKELQTTELYDVFEPIQIKEKLVSPYAKIAVASINDYDQYKIISTGTIANERRTVANENWGD